MNIVELVIFAFLGAVLGGLYFFLLYRTVLLQSAGGPALTLVPLFAARIGGAGLAFWLIAQHGAGPLIAALAGFLVARLAAQRIVRFD